MDNYSVKLPEIQHVFKDYAEAGRNGYFTERYWLKRKRTYNANTGIICEKLDKTDRGSWFAFPYRGLYAVDYRCVYCYADTVPLDSSSLDCPSHDSPSLDSSVSVPSVNDLSASTGLECTSLDDSALSYHSSGISTCSSASCDSSVNLLNNSTPSSSLPIRSPLLDNICHNPCSNGELRNNLFSPTSKRLIRRKCYVPEGYRALNIPLELNETAKEFFDIYHHQRIWQWKSKKEFVHLKREYLCDQLGGWRRWNELREFLLNNEIIECDNIYQPAAFEKGEGKSFGYRLHESLRQRKFFIVIKEEARKLKKNRYTTQPVVTWIEKNLQRLNVNRPSDEELTRLANPYGIQTSEGCSYILM